MPSTRLEIASSPHNRSNCGCPDCVAMARMLRRDGSDIVRSAVIFCEWRAARGRHGQLTRQERFDAERLWYLGGVRTMTDALYGMPEPEPPPPGRPTSDPRETPLCALSVASLVSRLMALYPHLTDKKLLSHFTRAKLARMVVCALDGLPLAPLPCQGAAVPA